MPERDHPNIFDQAHEIVDRAEKEHIDDLYKDIGYWQHKKDRCGCPQCTRSYQGAVDRFWDEIDRVKEAPGMDQEEWLLYQFALSKLDDIDHEAEGWENLDDYDDLDDGKDWR